MPPAPPGMPLGPDGKPLQVIRAPQGGLAMVDSGKRDEPTNWGRVGALATGDVAALVLFAAIGRASHGEPLDFETLTTAAPFIAGWAAAAGLLGGYGSDATSGRVGAAAAAAVKAWAVGVPLGLALRGVSRGYIPPMPFVVISMGVTAVLMIGWRTAFAALSPKAPQLSKAARAARRGDRSGGPFEFLELLLSLTKRW